MPIAKRLVRQGLLLAEADVAAGRNVDRVSVRLAIGDGTVHRRSLYEFAELPPPQICALSTRVLMRNYVLAKIVTRILEVAHASRSVGEYVCEQYEYMPPTVAPRNHNPTGSQKE